MKILTDFDYIFDNGDKLFFTSDTHFGHERIIQYCNRPFRDAAEMNEALIRNWNAAVPPDGTVFHLGDFAMGMDQDRIAGILSRLNGTIYLVAGNHDRHSLPPAVQDMFKDVMYQTMIKVGRKKLLLSHFPLLCYTGQDKGIDDTVIQLYGHVHSGPSSNGSDTERVRMCCFPGQYDVGVDNNGYAPVSYTDVIGKVIPALEKHNRRKRKDS